MGRPLSRRIEDWIVPWRELEWPLDWRALFGRPAPLALEIGFGNGEFLERELRSHPERNHVGIELSWTSATHLFRRLDRLTEETGERVHARVLLVEAEVAMRHLFATGSLTELFVNHPCPWPKERHHGRRLLKPDFLALAADRLVEEGPMTVVTDHAEYATWIGEVFEAQTALAPALGTTEVDALPGRETTKYQRKAMAAGIPIHYFPWRRAHAPEGLPPLPPRDPFDTMPSLTLQGACDPAHLFDGFAPVLHREQVEGVDVTVKLVAAYRRSDDQAWMVEALVKEDGLRQEFALVVLPQEGNQVLIKLGGLGRPHPTHGVKRAVWCAGSWLREHVPGLGIAHHNLGEEPTR